MSNAINTLNSGKDLNFVKLLILALVLPFSTTSFDGKVLTPFYKSYTVMNGSIGY